MADNFNGDTPHLIRCIEALLNLAAKGALAPHGIGGHARTLLEAAAVRLAADPLRESLHLIASTTTDPGAREEAQHALGVLVDGGNTPDPKDAHGSSHQVNPPQGRGGE